MKRDALWQQVIDGLETPAVQLRLDSALGNGKRAMVFAGRLHDPESLEHLQDLRLRVELIDRRIRISRLSVKGQEVNGNATGTIVLREPFDASALNISGQILPHPSFIRDLAGMIPAGMISEKTISGGGIPFRISGTLANPAFSLK